MSLPWLRFALGCYFIGLVYVFVALNRTSDLFSRIALHAASLGMVFHFVSLVELLVSGQVVWASIHNGESLLAFLSMTFLACWRSPKRIRNLTVPSSVLKLTNEVTLRAVGRASATLSD